MIYDEGSQLRIKLTIKKRTQKSYWSSDQTMPEAQNTSRLFRNMKQ
jgi:hypothetical protein